MITTISDGTDAKGRVKRISFTSGEQAKPRLVRLGGVGKNDARYWLSRVTKPTFRARDGSIQQSPHFAIAISFKNQRKNLSLHTSSQKEAARLARNLWNALQLTGSWPAALELWRQLGAKGTFDEELAKLRGQKVEVQANLTVGEFIEAYDKQIAKSPTREGYKRSLRLLVAEAFGIKRKGNSMAEIRRWKARVERVRLVDLSEERLNQWKRQRLERAQDNLAEKSARVSVNTLLRFSKSMFSKEVLKQLKLGVANPFKEIAYEKAKAAKYAATFDVKKVFAAAEAELGTEEKKVFLLAVCAGLRRHEIDYLEWGSFDWAHSSVVIRETKYFRAKTDDSHAVVPLDSAIMRRFVVWYEEHLEAQIDAKPKWQNNFVIQAPFARPRLDKSYIRYRCSYVFRNVTDFLRKHGVTGPRPLHALRKESGSLVNSTQGIHAASRFLRHSNIKITADIYADNRGMQPIRISDLEG